MDFIFINTQELSALDGLPYAQQVAYLRGIKPYMDRNTSIVGGIKRRISYQSLTEALYVEPHQGFTSSGSPSRQQLRRIIKGLEKAGLIEIQSVDKHLILKCLLANSDKSAQNKADTNQTHFPGRVNHTVNDDITADYQNKLPKPDIGERVKPDIPHNSVKDLICLGEQFEKFWESYPQPADKLRAWHAFVEVNPDEFLFEQMMGALKHQITSYEQLQKQGAWVPNWKYPANWLAQKSWNHAVTVPIAKELKNENSQRRHAATNAFDVFWNSCGQGADLNFDDLSPV
ncbi:MAG: hypothetical protein H0U75_01185 [Legionella sp.]|nr:hypothetical protein [Legionella sp.]